MLKTFELDSIRSIKFSVYEKQRPATFNSVPLLRYMVLQCSKMSLQSLLVQRQSKARCTNTQFALPGLTAHHKSITTSASIQNEDTELAKQSQQISKQCTTVQKRHTGSAKPGQGVSTQNLSTANVSTQNQDTKLLKRTHQISAQNRTTINLSLQNQKPKLTKQIQRVPPQSMTTSVCTQNRNTELLNQTPQVPVQYAINTNVSIQDHDIKPSKPNSFPKNRLARYKEPKASYLQIKQPVSKCTVDTITTKKMVKIIREENLKQEVRNLTSMKKQSRKLAEALKPSTQVKNVKLLGKTKLDNKKELNNSDNRSECMNKESVRYAAGKDNERSNEICLCNAAGRDTDESVEITLESQNQKQAMKNESRNYYNSAKESLRHLASNSVAISRTSLKNNKRLNKNKLKKNTGNLQHVSIIRKATNTALKSFTVPLLQNNKYTTVRNPIPPFNSPNTMTIQAESLNNAKTEAEQTDNKCRTPKAIIAKLKKTSFLNNTEDKLINTKYKNINAGTQNYTITPILNHIEEKINKIEPVITVETRNIETHTPTSEITYKPKQNMTPIADQNVNHVSPEIRISASLETAHPNKYPHRETPQSTKSILRSNLLKSAQSNTNNTPESSLVDIHHKQQMSRKFIPSNFDTKVETMDDEYQQLKNKTSPTCSELGKVTILRISSTPAVLLSPAKVSKLMENQMFDVYGKKYLSKRTSFPRKIKYRDTHFLYLKRIKRLPRIINYPHYLKGRQLMVKYRHTFTSFVRRDCSLRKLETMQLIQRLGCIPPRTQISVDPRLPFYYKQNRASILRVKLKIKGSVTSSFDSDHLKKFGKPPFRTCIHL